jgi:small subunit ribosomal protein S17
MEETKQRGIVKERVGKVLSSKMDKTVVVAIETLVKHPVYSKVMRRTKKLYAHDEENRCGVGDTVRVIETRPLSKTKRWRVSAILERAK